MNINPYTTPRSNISSDNDTSFISDIYKWKRSGKYLYLSLLALFFWFGLNVFFWTSLLEDGGLDFFKYFNDFEVLLTIVFVIAFQFPGVAFFKLTIYKINFQSFILKNGIDLIFLTALISLIIILSRVTWLKIL